MPGGDIPGGFLEEGCLTWSPGLTGLTKVEGETFQAEESAQAPTVPPHPTLQGPEPPYPDMGGHSPSPHHTIPHHTTPHHTIVGCLQTPIDGDTHFSRTWEPPSHSRLGGTMPDGPGPIFPCGTLLSLLQCHCYNVRHYNIQVFRSCFCANAF